MAIYTADQLKGQGSAGENLLLNNTYTFTFTNPGDSSYFFMESNRNNNGNYNTVGGTFGATVTNGTWTNNSTAGLISDKYIMGCVVPPGTSSISFIPTNPFPLGIRYKFRGTGTLSMSSSFIPLPSPPVYYTNGFDAGNKLSYPGSGSLWTNLSGSVNATLFNGITYSSTDGSGSLRFDGFDDYASIPYNTTFDFSNGTYAINMWVKIGSINTGGSVLTGKFDFNNAIFDWLFFLTDASTISVLTDAGSTDFGISSLNLNTWYLISFTSTSNVLSTYINGVKQGASQTFALSNNLTTGNFVDLMNNSDATFPLSGSLSVVEYWNTPLSGSEILTYFNNTKTRFGY